MGKYDFWRDFGGFYEGERFIGQEQTDSSHNIRRNQLRQKKY